METFERITRGFPVAARIPKRRVVIRFIYHALFLLAVYIVQALVLPYIKALPSTPLILPLAAVGVAMFEGGGRGAVAGLMAGALCDMAMNQAVAQFTVLLTFISIVVCVLADAVLAPGFMAYFALCIGTLIACSFMQMFTLLFFDGVAPVFLIHEALQQSLISLPFTVPIYYASRALRYT